MTARSTDPSSHRPAIIPGISQCQDPPDAFPETGLAGCTPEHLPGVSPTTGQYCLVTG
jgi:hypothetical protein